MKEKKQVNEGKQAFLKKILPDVSILSILMLLAIFLPYANYTYKKIKYTVSGMEFITGKVIAGGKVTIQTNLAMCALLVAVIAIAAISLLYGRLKPKVSAGIITIAAIVSIAANIVIVTKVEKMLEGTKKIGISSGSAILVILGVLLLVRGLHLLWIEKVVSTLDFMIIPGMLYFIINNYVPMLGISIAFKKIDYSVGIWESPWVGFQNFKVLFSHTGSIFKSDAFIITRNTLLYNISFIIIGTIMGIVVGICLADIFSKVLQKFFQTTILLPQLISMVIVAYIVYAFLGNETGMVNKMLGDENTINFYAKKNYWPFILVFINTWKQLGYNAIIFLSSIVGIDRSIYEAAKVDGASKWKQIRYVTLPMLRPTIITLTLLQVGRIFYSDFGLFFQVPLDSGALYDVTNTIDTYVYRCLMVLNNISTSSAASTYQAVVGFAIVFAINMLVRKMDKENALF